MATSSWARRTADDWPPVADPDAARAVELLVAVVAALPVVDVAVLAATALAANWAWSRSRAVMVLPWAVIRAVTAWTQA